MRKRIKKTNPPPELFWKEIVECWFNFCREKKNETPSFDGSAPRDLRNIIITLRERAEKSNLQWNLYTALNRFKTFLDFAYQDKWLQDHWLLMNINRQKDRIFYEIRKHISRQPVDPFQ